MVQDHFALERSRAGEPEGFGLTWPFMEHIMIRYPLPVAELKTRTSIVRIGYDELMSILLPLITVAAAVLSGEQEEDEGSVIAPRLGVRPTKTVLERLIELIRPFEGKRLPEEQLEPMLIRVGFDVIGSGAHRTVIDLEDGRVAKIDRYRGLVNLVEDQIWFDHQGEIPALMPVVSVHLDGMILVMERVSSPWACTDEEGLTREIDDFPLRVLDAELFTNWGCHGGELRLFDYGSGIEE